MLNQLAKMVQATGRTPLEALMLATKLLSMAKSRIAWGPTTENTILVILYQFLTWTEDVQSQVQAQLLIDYRIERIVFAEQLLDEFDYLKNRPYEQY